jgi:type 1 glutamine amidotransferase
MAPAKAPGAIRRSPIRCRAPKCRLPAFPRFRLTSVSALATLCCLSGLYGLCGPLYANANAADPIRVVFLGGGSTSHNPDSMRTVMIPVFAKAGMQVEYHTNESVLNADSLSRFDAMFVYNAKKGSKTDKTPDLTTAQEDALYAWVEAGHAFVAAHSASSSYLENPRWAQLIGAEYTQHGNDFKYVTIAKPEHGAMREVKPPTGWDEGRLHNFLKQDLTILETLNDEKTPWTWVRPQGKGWVYYTSSGHDIRTWSDTAYQGQLVQAIRWASAAAHPTGLAATGGEASAATASGPIAAPIGAPAAVPLFGSRPGKPRDARGRRVNLQVTPRGGA